MTVTKTANANWEMTIDILDQVLLPKIDAGPGAILSDNFKGHSTKQGKEKIKQHQFLSWIIMGGGLTPVAQPLDKVVNKIFKGFFHDYYDKHVFTAPLHPKTNHPIASSHSCYVSGWLDPRKRLHLSW